MIAQLKSFVIYLLWLLTSALFLPLCLILSLLPASLRYDNRFYFFIARLWAKSLIISTFTKLSIEGEGNIPTKPAVLVMNHSSALDIPLMEMLLGSDPRIWLSKQEYGKVPLFGTIMKRMHVLVDREKPVKAAKALGKIYMLGKRGKSHILMFPEGRRSRNGELGEFFEGFAALAKKLNRSVVPVFVTGADKVMPPGGLMVYPGECVINLVVGECFFYDGKEGVRDFAFRVESWFQEKSLEKSRLFKRLPYKN